MGATAPTLSTRFQSPASPYDQPLFSGKLAVTIRQFSKKFDHVTEDSGKRATHQLKIFEKDRYGSAAKTANPQIIIIFSDGVISDRALM